VLECSDNTKKRSAVKVQSKNEIESGFS
jgi:hypothetical protein